MCCCNPGGELCCVWYGCTQECQSAPFRRQYNAFLPDHSSLSITQIVYLIINKQANFTHNLWSRHNNISSNSQSNWRAIPGLQETL